MEKKENAYFTVEAAMVFPFLLLIQIGLVYLLFFQYNRCLLEQDAAVLLVRAGAMEKEDTWVLTQRMEAAAENIYQEKYVLWENASPLFQLKKNVLGISWSGSQILPGRNREWDESGSWQAGVSYKTDRISPLEIVRSTNKKPEEKR